MFYKFLFHYFVPVIKTIEIMKQQSFTATFSLHNGKTSGEITVDATDWQHASMLINEVLNGRGQWSLMWDLSENEFFNPEIEITEIDFNL